MSSSIACKEHGARSSRAPPHGSEADPSRSNEVGGPFWVTDHNKALAFGSRPAQPTNLQMRGDDLVI